jgi:hypothetical protein
MSSTLRFEHRFASGAVCRTWIDVDAVGGAGSGFVPRFFWSGAKAGREELVAWLGEVFTEVADHVGALLAFTTVPPHFGTGGGRREIWLCMPGRSKPWRGTWAPRVFLVLSPWQEEAERRGRFVLRFGKYRGKQLRDVDPEYLRWVLHNFTGLWPETRNAIAHYLDALSQ